MRQDHLGFMSGRILKGTEQVMEHGIATRPPGIVRPLPEVFPPPRGTRRIAVTLIDITIRITSQGWSALYHPYCLSCDKGKGEQVLVDADLLWFNPVFMEPVAVKRGVVGCRLYRVPDTGPVHR